MKVFSLQMAFFSFCFQCCIGPFNYDASLQSRDWYALPLELIFHSIGVCGTTNASVLRS